MGSSEPPALVQAVGALRCVASPTSQAPVPAQPLTLVGCPSPHPPWTLQRAHQNTLVSQSLS